ncbi:MAG: tetratricopeptide repeat protein, partial [Planctomycetota bacterium]
SREGRGAWVVLALLAVAVLAAAGFKALSLLPGARADGERQTPVRPELAAPAPALAPEVAASGPDPAGEPEASDERPYDLNDQAIAALEAGRLDEAVALLEEATAARPDVATFGANLGEAYLRRAQARGKSGADGAYDDYAAALRWIEDPERRALIETLLERHRRIRDEERDFVVEPTLHFTFRYDGSREGLSDGVDRLKVLLEDTYQEFGERFGRRPVEAGEGRIEVILYDAAGFDKVTGLGDWAGGVFDGKIRVPVEDLRTELRFARVQGVLRHETAHAFTRSIGGTAVPSWLNEGVAQWLEEPARRGADVGLARARLGASSLFPLARLNGNLVGWQDRGDVARAYDQALAFVDHLAVQYGPDLVFSMIAACRDRGVEGAAGYFRERTLVDLDAILGDLADSLPR